MVINQIPRDMQTSPSFGHDTMNELVERIRIQRLAPTPSITVTPVREICKTALLKLRLYSTNS
jgi:hypothetical protein